MGLSAAIRNRFTTARTFASRLRRWPGRWASWRIWITPAFVVSAAFYVLILVYWTIAPSQLLNDGCDWVLTELQFVGESDCVASRGELIGIASIDVVVGWAFALLTRSLLRNPWRSYLGDRVRKSLQTTDQLWIGIGLSTTATAVLTAWLPNETVTGDPEQRLLAIDGFWQHALRTLAWTKWLLLFAALCVGIFAIWNYLSQMSLPDHEGQLETGRSPDPRPDEIAVCASGGGIRSAGFALGALWELEQKPVMDDVRAMAAVSGGNYAATSWVLHKSIGNQRPAQHLIRRLYGDADPFEDNRPVADVKVRNWSEQANLHPNWQRSRNPALHRYLANGPGGLYRAGLFVFLAMTFNVVVLTSLIMVFAWPAGRFVRSHVLFGPPGIDGAAPDQVVNDIAVGSLRYWVPGLSYLAIAGLLLLLAAWLYCPPPQASPGSPGSPQSDDVHWSWRLPSMTVTAAAIGALLLAVNVVGPVLLREVIRLLNDRAFLIGVAVAGGVILLAAVLGVASNVFQRVIPRLGGGALILLTAMAFGRFAHDAAIPGRFFSSPWWWAGAGIITLVCAVTFDLQPISLRELYRNRLANSFLGDEAALKPADYLHRFFREDDPGPPPKVTWDALCRDDLPELIVCCSASRVGLAPSGIPAESFTISPYEVVHRQADRTRRVPTSDYLTALTSTVHQPLRSPAGWMAISGAAISSSLGRNSVGSAGAFLAALNVSLGAWLPSVRSVHSEADRDGSILSSDTERTTPPAFLRPLAQVAWPTKGELPPPGLGLLVSEILGLYDPQTLYSYVSDGGHYENLGLVELLQRGYRTIVCIDASNDKAGSYQTLRDAVDVADTSLDDRLFFDLDALPPSDDQTVPEQLVYRLPFYRWEDRDARSASNVLGTIFYAKLQHTKNLPIHLREYVNIYRQAPRVSTANQILNDNQFLFLLLVGRLAGQELLDTLEQHLRPATSGGPLVTGTPPTPYRLSTRSP